MPAITILPDGSYKVAADGATGRGDTLDAALEALAIGLRAIMQGQKPDDIDPSRPECIEPASEPFMES